MKTSQKIKSRPSTVKGRAFHLSSGSHASFRLIPWLLLLAILLFSGCHQPAPKAKRPIVITEMHREIIMKFLMAYKLKQDEKEFLKDDIWPGQDSR